MDDQSMKHTLETALAAFADPARRDAYFDTLYADDVVLHGYAPEPLRGKAAVKAFYAPLFDAFPDCRVDVEALLVEGDTLACRFLFKGTHRGPFQGAPATGRSFAVPGMTMLRFDGPRCVERWAVTDFLSLMIQIGALPAPGQRGGAREDLA